MAEVNMDAKSYKMSKDLSLSLPNNFFKKKSVLSIEPKMVDKIWAHSPIAL